MDRVAKIYCLVDPRDGLARYVGCSWNPEGRTTPSASGQARQKWVTTLRSLDLKPRLVILERVQPETCSGEREVWWMDHLRARGNPLLNSVMGKIGPMPRDFSFLRDFRDKHRVNVGCVHGCSEHAQSNPWPSRRRRHLAAAS